jgi:hypothetical protein
MAAGETFADCFSEQFNYNQGHHDTYKCVNCVTLESQLKETVLELSSSQFPIKLLYKELNVVTALHEHACMP